MYFLSKFTWSNIMPELPEVETVTNALNLSIKNLIIRRVMIYRSDLRINVSKNMNKFCEGARILYVKRRAKFGQIYLDNNYVIVFHLGMSGRMIIEKLHSFEKKKHDHLYFDLECSGQKEQSIRLIYNDPRRFGFINIYKNSSNQFKNIFKNIGPEPFSDNFNASELHKKFKKKSTSVKAALLNQKLVAGLGNIYVSEALFASFISPNKIVSNLSLVKLTKLVSQIKQVLIKAIEVGGSTIQDHKNIDGKIGYFQNYFLVYGREGKKCKNKKCDSKIKRIIQNGRSTFYCPTCQK